MSAGAPALPLGLDPLIAEAKQRARRRRLLALAAAGVLALAAVGADLAVSGSGGGSSGVVPWLPTRPDLGPANPPLAPACTASQLDATLFLQGATQSLVGPISIVNRSSRPCSLLGRPKLSFAGATSQWQETNFHVPGAMPFDPLAPPRGSLRALAPREHVSVMLWWSNWCGTGAKPDGNLTPSPSAIVLALPSGGRLRLTHAEMKGGLPSPVCNGGAGSLSTLQASRYTPFVPQGPPSSALPLRVSIAPSSGPPLVVKGRHVVGPTLAAHAGSWLSYTVVLTNTSKRAFHFGPTCPAYTEGFGVIEKQVYVLNCHAVGVIAPRQSVRFAMRVHVPGNVTNFGSLGWTLAPHSYNAPQTLAIVERK